MRNSFADHVCSSPYSWLLWGACGIYICVGLLSLGLSSGFGFGLRLAARGALAAVARGVSPVDPTACMDARVKGWGRIRVRVRVRVRVMVRVRVRVRVRLVLVLGFREVLRWIRTADRVFGGHIDIVDLSARGRIAQPAH